MKDFRRESDEYIVLNAFKDGTSKGRKGDAKDLKQFAEYVKALRKDRALLYLGEKE